MRGVFAALIGVAALGLPSLATAAPSPDRPPAWRSIGGDAVYRPPLFKRNFLPAPVVSGGYALYDGDARFAGPTTIRLVDSPGVEDLRAAVEAAAEELTEITGLAVDVAPGLTSALEPGMGEVLLMVSTVSPCDGDWAGCGGPIYGGTPDQLLVTGGRVWLRPDTTTYPPDEMRHLVDHELGHAFNLDHYSLTYRGEHQVMHPYLYDSSTYRPGDRAGLRHVAGLPPEIDEGSPPYNDDFVHAEELPYSGGTLAGTTALATSEDGEPDHGSPAGDATVWYSVNGPTAGVVTMAVDAPGSVLAAYTGYELDDLDELDAGPGAVDVPIEPFTTVWIAVAGAGGVTGPFTLTWTFVPGNDDFADAEVLGGELGSTSGTTRGATREAGEPEHFDGATAGSTWYRFTPAYRSILALNTAGSTFDTVVAVYTGSAVDDLQQVGVNDDGGGTGLTTSFLQLELEEGTPYSIAVTGFAQGAGDVWLGWTVSPSGIWSRSLDAACDEDVTPAPPFSDVTGLETHDRGIGCVAWYGVAMGRDGRFDPGDPVTRGQMASFVARLVDASWADLPEADVGADAFSDDDESVHEDNIDRLAAAGIVGGRAPGIYAPDALVTRAQMATFLIRAYEFISGRPLPPAVTDYFGDDDGDAHEPNIDLAAQLGLTGGVSDRMFAPGTALRRDQMASFLARELALLVAEGRALPPDIVL